MNSLGSVFGRFNSEGSTRDDEHRTAMKAALEKLQLGTLQIAEARTIEDLDIGRTFYQSALAELQQVIRTAKRERGIALRPVAECEELHRQLVRRFYNKAAPPLTPREKRQARAAE